MKKLTKEVHAFLSPGKGLPLLLIPEYSGINKEQRIHDRSKTAHRKPPVKCLLTERVAISFSSGPHFVRTLHYDPSILGGPARHGS